MGVMLKEKEIERSMNWFKVIKIEKFSNKTTSNVFLWK